MAAREVARGVEAIRRVAQVFPNATRLVARDQFGSPVTIEPGTVWGGERMFVTSLGGEVAFTVGDRLYTQGTGDFIRDTYLIALGQGARRAAWLIPIAQAEMAFLMAFGGTIAGAAGTIAAVTVFFAKVATFYHTHRSEVNTAVRHLGPVWSGLNTLRTRCPRLFWLLARGLGSQALQSAGQGVGASDVAWFLGKLVGGAARAPELTLVGLLAVAGKVLALTTVIRGPGMVSQGAPAQARQLVQDLARQGITITEGEALPVITEACLRNPENQRLLRGLVTDAEKARPIVEGLSRALRIEGGV